jgi:hypothetical protein
MLIKVITKTCIYCGEKGLLRVSPVALRKYQQGALVQDAFPDFSSDEREQLMTGTHAECWNKLFPEEEEG